MNIGNVIHVEVKGNLTTFDVYIIEEEICGNHCLTINTRKKNGDGPNTQDYLC